MMIYSTKNAILDLGFVDGCVRENCSRELQMQEPLEIALDRMEQAAVSGKLEDPQFLYDLGFVRGVIWLDPMPGAYSLAMDRLMEYFVEGAVDWYQLPQPFIGREHKDPSLSEDLRDEIQSDYVLEGREYAEETANRAGFTDPYLIDRIIPPKCGDGSLSVWGINPAQEQEAEADLPTVADQTDEATQAGVDDGDKKEMLNDRRSAHHSISDDRVEEIRKMSGTMTDDEIAIETKTSRSTVLRFRETHGIEKDKGPRDGCGRPSYEWEPWQKQKLIEMKLAGHSYGEISEAVGKTRSQCSGMWFWEKKKLEAASDERGDDGLVNDKIEPEVEEPKSEELEADLSEDEESEEVDQAEAVPEPSPPQGLTLAHPGYAGKREDGQLQDEDWPDIKARLAKGDTRRAIAGDYDAELEDLDFFIASNQRREAKQPPGEARAPL